MRALPVGLFPQGLRPGMDEGRQFNLTFHGPSPIVELIRRESQRWAPACCFCVADADNTGNAV